VFYRPNSLCPIDVAELNPEAGDWGLDPKSVSKVACLTFSYFYALEEWSSFFI